MKTIVLFATAALFHTLTITYAQATGEYFPNWAAGASGPHVCYLDDGSQSVPDSAPLFSSLEECCSTHYGWNLSECLGNGPSLEYFPNWGASPDVCLRDDGTRTVPAGAPLYSDLSACCANQYYWNLRECNNVELGPSNKYFPNWQRTPHVCLLDDGTNTIPAGAPFFDDLASCCAMHYPFNIEECNRGAPAAPSTASPSTSPTTLSPTTSGLRGATNAPTSAATAGPTVRSVTATTKFTAQNATSSQQFGSSLVVLDNFSVVGAPEDNNSTGAVFVFSNVDGIITQTAKLTASDGQPGDRFGASLDAISFGIVVIGAPGASQYRGAVYEFQNRTGTWEQTEKVASDASASPSLFFGTSVSIFGEGFLTVGEINAFHVFTYRGNSEGYVESEVFKSDRFGALGVSMSFSDRQGSIPGVLAVGAPASNGTGSVLLFGVERDVVPEVLLPPETDRSPGMQFGFSIDITDDIVAVGAPLAGGSVYVYENTGNSTTANFTSVTKLTPSDGQHNDLFGDSVAIFRDSVIFVGAPAAGGKGAVYVFRKIDGSWTETLKIIAYDAEEADNFGTSLEVSDESLFIGSPLDDDNNATNSGAVYVIDLA